MQFTQPKNATRWIFSGYGSSKAINGNTSLEVVSFILTSLYTGYYFIAKRVHLQHDNHCSNCIKNNGIAAYVRHRMERFPLFNVPKARLGEYWALRPTGR